MSKHSVKDWKKDHVQRLAHLSRITISSEEEKILESQLGNILEYVAVLNIVSTDGVEPLYSANELLQQKLHQSTDSEAQEQPSAPLLGGGADQVELAPESMAEHYLVSKVLGEK